MAELLTFEDFEPHLNTGFEAGFGKHIDTLTLTELRRGKFPIPGGQRVPFLLIFRSTRSDFRYEHQVLELTHPVMGKLAIDIAPTQRNDDGTFEYQAVFN